jgi:uncharacterized membrane protein
MTAARPRRGYLDWMRGLAVLIMIEAHLLDSWTRVGDRQSWHFAWAMILGGFGAPLFLFLAGISVALAGGSGLRRTGERSASARRIVRRGLWIFALAFLFRLQAWILGWGAARTLLKVDILNIMGLCIVAGGFLWGTFRGTRSRLAAFGAATLATAFLTPLVQQTALLGPLPDPLEGYIRPVAGMSNFCLFPWAAFLFAGGFVGVLIDDVRTREDESRLNWWVFASGAGLAIAAYGASFLPSLYAHTEFWRSSPAFFLIRTGILTAAVGVAYAWNAGPAESGWSPFRQLGRTSLFIYWIHVELVYGLISLPLHKALTLPYAWAALGLFSAVMLACSLLRDRVAAWWTGRQARPALHTRPTEASST